MAQADYKVRCLEENEVAEGRRGGIHPDYQRSGVYYKRNKLIVFVTPNIISYDARE